MSSAAEQRKELEAAREKLAQLEAELRQELAGLPEKYGFDSTRAFLAAVRAARTDRPGRRLGKNSVIRKRKKKRAVITDATRAEVKKLVALGKTGAQIAKAVGISLPSVHNIKKTLGMIRKK